ncbi:MAG: Holliday junction resolvase RuvX [Bacteroidaceae bacterium]|nr:Holliday junction resolvase RuvX [Bacteroidaceae bacterium]
MRVLALDYGKKRTGIAVTDPLQLIAGALTTVATTDLEHFVLDYVAREPVERILVGWPRQMNGQDSENMARITPFVNRLRKLLPEIPVELTDERFTSVMAHRTMLESGIGRKARQDKALVDEIAATIILQGWMEAKNNR